MAASLGVPLRYLRLQESLETGPSAECMQAYRADEAGEERLRIACDPDIWGVRRPTLKPGPDASQSRGPWRQSGTGRSFDNASSVLVWRYDRKRNTTLGERTCVSYGTPPGGTASQHLAPRTGFLRVLTGHSVIDWRSNCTPPSSNSKPFRRGTDVSCGCSAAIVGRLATDARASLSHGLGRS